ncbi:cytochrome P450 [Gloeophyllum trabeum ATCC 11539]|uniref:Cytochrome P450 n=1 Tax=Gloeophyllum trabeum (strain ATCC 11539 / FP-39264 / Madison 617) TaxID=670483 RepID=S7RII7_GLOTA|nr:cytochrome P450 [Gloeophyllum trabeum ATCC 11539]EPQ54140.1 cytochrome P450 [Gloeophyllum trabeum ATCC 11539]
MGLLVTGTNATAPIVSASLQGIVYGFSTCTFAITIWVLALQKGIRVHYGMLIVACTLWGLSTIRMILDIYLTTHAFVAYMFSRPLGPEESLSSFNKPPQLLDNTIYGLQTLIGDAVVIYRCYIVWKSWVAVVFPLLCWGASLGSILYILNSSAKGQTGPQIILFYSLTLATNLSATPSINTFAALTELKGRQELHAKYRPIVRIRPNELSVTDADLLPSIMGPDGVPKRPCRRISGKKGAGAKEAKGRSLIGARNKDQHAEVRRVWNQAFTPTAVKGYEPAIARRAAQLVDELKGSLEKYGNTGRVDLAQWTSFFTFDIMGDIAGGFELMCNGDEHQLVQNLEKGLYLPALTQQIPWASDFLPYFPFLGQYMKALAQLGHKQATRRLNEGSVYDDLFYYLLNDPDAKGAQTPIPIVVSNSVSSIIAGSDIV